MKPSYDWFWLPWWKKIGSWALAVLFFLIAQGDNRAPRQTWFEHWDWWRENYGTW